MTVVDRLESLPIGSFHRRIVMLAGLGTLFDAFDVVLFSFVIPGLILTWHLSDAGIGGIISLGLFGMLVGAAAAGPLADRFGRRRVFLWTLVVYGVGTALAAVTPSLTWFLVLRFVVGLGLGAELPVATTLVSEFIPTRSRGRYVVFLETFWAVGGVLAALVAWAIIPTFGWRWGFAVGAIPALLAGVLRRSVPESPRYLEKAGRMAEAEAAVRDVERELGVEAVPLAPTAPASETPAAPGRVAVSLRRGVLLWSLWFLANFAYYGIFIWMPTILVQRGFTLVNAFGYVFVMALAQFPGYFVAAWAIERLGRRWVLILSLVGAALFAWLYGGASNPITLLVYGAILTFFDLASWGATYSYTVELYPTRHRASGSGWAMGFGRLGGIVGPMAVGFLLAGRTPLSLVYGLFTGVLLLAALLILVLGEETRGKRLEEIAS